MSFRSVFRIVLAAGLLGGGTALAQSEGGYTPLEDYEIEAGDELVPPPPPPPEEKRAATRAFIKGELTRVGATKLVTDNNRIGVRIGYEFLEETREIQVAGTAETAFVVDQTHYVVLTPEFDYKSEKEGGLRVGLGVPLRLKLYGPNYQCVPAPPPADDPICTSTGDSFGNAGQVRKADWDEPSDFAKVIRYIQYGRKEYNFFLQISQLDAATIGHGPIVRRYFANADLDTSRVGLEFDHYGKFAGFEFHLNDIVTPVELAVTGSDANVGLVVGLLAFIKPGALFSDSVFGKSLSIGVTYAAEINAPGSLEFDAADRVRTEPNTLNPVYVGRLVDIAGVDVEFKVIKNKTTDIKPFFDFSFLRDQFLGANGGGWGATAGVLGRFNFVSGSGEDETIHALRTIVEVRTHAGNYVPSYFDTFYEVEKYAYERNPLNTAQWLTKYEVLTTGQIPGRSPTDRHFSTYLEFNWAPQDVFAFGTAIELSTAPRGNNFYIHFELPKWKLFEILATYHKRGFSNFQTFFDIQADDSVFYLSGRLTVLPILFINARLWRSFQFSSNDATLKLFETRTGLSLDVELGWEF